MKFKKINVKFKDGENLELCGVDTDFDTEYYYFRSEVVSYTVAKDEVKFVRFEK